MSEMTFKRLGRADNTPGKELETFPAPAAVTEVHFISDELTTFCPITHQPDFNTVEISYVPDALCVESKSLKLYLWSFREEALFGETLAHTIAHDIYDALRPQSCRVILHQNVRGGLKMTATAELPTPVQR